MQSRPFSFRTRKKSLERFKKEVFDLLVIGGGITGAAVARDATSRGLKVALVERSDFAYGTSSRSSKLIHGGLRYLENFEIGLVFEALAERAQLLKTAPYRVRPLPFFLPVYQGDTHGRGLLGLGLWLYDFLSLFRTPQFHKNLSKKKLLEEIPFLESQKLLGGFRYFDASMWDDLLTVETLRSAQEAGAAVANYVEALSPLWNQGQISGFVLRDVENPENHFEIQAHRTVSCVGPWTDQLGLQVSRQWKNCLKPSKGVHLVFDLERIPIPGALVMSHPQDGRIVFVVPRADLGAGVVIVGTTDAPASIDPEQSQVTRLDVEYLLGLLEKYFPSLKLKAQDILSAYVGVRPLWDEGLRSATTLQKVSREHSITDGPGGMVIVVGGKYTTHRSMAQEIVDFILTSWKRDQNQSGVPPYPRVRIGASQTRAPVNPQATREAIARCQAQLQHPFENPKIPEQLWSRYGAEAIGFKSLDIKTGKQLEDPPGFPWIEAQLRYAIQSEMVIHLEDFYLRRVPLYTARKDHGLPWAESLSTVWAQENGVGEHEKQVELQRLYQECARRSAWSE